MTASSGKIVEMSNEPRGCGEIQEKALYMGAQPGSGVLATWGWVLGKLWDSGEGESIRYSPDVLPNRQQIQIDWAGTKAAGRLTDEPVKADDEGLFAVADHVGSVHYSPWSFYLETVARGPNRRIRRDTAKLWAKETPFPILFGSKDVPWFNSRAHAEMFLVWATTELLIPIEAWDWTPSWKEELFLSSNGNNGTGHPAMLVIKALEMAKEEGQEVPTEVKPSSYQRAIFGVSWVTRICQVLDDEDELDSDLAEAGVQKAILVEEVTNE